MYWMTDDDHVEAAAIAQAYDERVPEHFVDAEVAARGVGVGRLVTTDDGGKGFASQWVYDGGFVPVIEVHFAVRPPSCDYPTSWYSPNQLKPVWTK